MITYKAHNKGMFFLFLLLGLALIPIIAAVIIGLVVIVWVLTIPYVVYKFIRGERNIRTIYSGVMPQAYIREREADSALFIEGEFKQVDEDSLGTKQ